MNKLEDIKHHYILTVALTLILVSIMYATIGLVPYGEFTLNFSDMNSCYIPQILELKHILLNGDFSSLLHIWNRIDGSTPIGMANIGILLNPLLIIYFILPDTYAHLATNIYIMVKFVLSSLSFLYMLKHLFPRREDFVVQIFISVAWSLCIHAVMMCYIIIWTDFFVVLPLYFLLLYRMLDERTTSSKIKFTLCLTYMFIANFYMAYIVVMFSALVAITFAFYLNLKGKELLKNIFWYITGHIIALVIALPILYPTFSIIVKQHIVNFKLSVGIAQSPLDVVTKLCTGYFNDILSSNSIYIFIGIVAVTFLFVLLFSKELSWKIKLSELWIPFVMVLSFIFNPLYLFWHAFKEPAGFPARMSFCFIFWVLYLVYKYYNTVKITLNAVLAGAIVLIISLIGYMMNSMLPLWMIFPVSFFIFLLLTSRKQTLVPILVSLEICATSIYVFNIMFQDYGLPKKKEYLGYKIIAQENIKKLKNDLDMTKFERVAVIDPTFRDYNYSEIYDLKGVTGFNNITCNPFLVSTQYFHSNTLLKNTILLHNLTDLSKFCLGVKYGVSLREDIPYEVYDNDTCLGFVVQDKILKEDMDFDYNPSQRQDMLVSRFLGKEISLFKEIGTLNSDKTILTFDTEAGKTYVGTSNTGKGDLYLHKKFAGRDLAENTLGVYTYIGDGKTHTFDLGVPVQEEFYKTDEKQIDVTPHVYEYDTEKCKEVIDTLKEQSFVVDSYDNFEIRGHLTAKEDNSLVYMSLPETNLKITVNGVPTENEEPIPGYLGFRVNAGYNKITIKYSYF